MNLIPSDWIHRSSLYAALLVAWVAMMGSLYFSEVAGYVPCTLCWYQRILMYPLAAILAIGLLRRDSHLPYLVLPFTLVGEGIAGYHYLLQKTEIFGRVATCSSGIPCTTTWINWFGFVTIAFLAMIGFLLITIFMLLAFYYTDEPVPSETDTTPWLPVGSIIAVVLVAFVLLAQMHSQPSQAAAPAFTPLQSTDSTTLEQTSVDIRQGQELYQEACAACHGAQGEGVANLGNPLLGTDFIRNQSDQELLVLIRNGRAHDDPQNEIGVTMPPSGGRTDLTDAELYAVIGYLKNGSQE